MSPDNAKPSASPSQPGDAAPTSGTRLFFSQPVAWVVLAISLAASGGGVVISRMHAELGALKQFDEETNRIRSLLNERMLVYQDVLHGAVGLYAASYSVERAEWAAYQESVSIEKRFPGIDGVGFMACVPQERLDEFLRSTREDKSPDFAVKNAGTNPELFIIKYISPEAPHQALLGEDRSVREEIRVAAEKARDTGATVVSGPVLSEGDDAASEQTRCLMLLPVYRRGLPTGTVAERRANIEGWVFARFTTAELMRGVLANKPPTLRVEVFDGLTTDAGKRIFAENDARETGPAGFEPRFSEDAPVALPGRTWTLRFTTRPGFEDTIPRMLSVLVGASGVLISLLLFGIAWSLSSTRARAVAIAAEMTSTLRETTERLRKEVVFRKHAEQSIKESEAIYHSLVESLPMNIWRKNWQGRFTFANQRFCNEVGLARAEIMGKTDFDLFPRELAEKREMADQQVLETGDTLETVEEVRLGEGQARSLHIIRTPIRDAAGNVAGLMGIFWDVTASRQAEVLLEHERFLLRTLMEHLPDRIYFKDRQSRFLRNSRAHLQRFGLTDPKEAMGKTDFDFFTEEHARQAFEDEQEVIRTGRAISKEEKETWPDGSITWAWSTKLPLRDERGQTIGTFGISRDITDRRRAEEGMRLAKEAAEEADRAKSQFLANMSHELRTPLNSVIGFANILLKNKGGNLRPEELTFLSRILANGKHLLELINQVLDLSKIEARRLEIEWTTVGVDTLVAEVVAQLEGQVRDRALTLKADVPPQVATLATDRQKLKQVLINLIGNALKFTETGGVTVRVVTDPGNHTPRRIDVVDTGIGIPKEKLALVFEAFQQADSATTRKYGGTGLGLTISRALCQLLGYRLEVTSEVGKGSTFSICFPPPETTPPAREPVSAPAAPLVALTRPRADAAGLKGKLVLVIDDELDSRTLLMHMIEDFGCKVLAASSGEQGLRMAREFHPHLITVDLLMPHMHGADVIQAIKADPQLRSLPLVVVSIVAGEPEGRVLGAVDLLKKPIIREELLAVIQRNLARTRPRVLVVDDDEDARRIMLSVLEDKNAEVQTAANGREALAQVEQDPPDLVLLDLMMPVLDGFGFLDAIRADPRLLHLPVVVITAKELSAGEIARLKRESLKVVRKSGDFAEELRRLLVELLQAPSRGPTGRET